MHADAKLLDLLRGRHPVRLVLARWVQHPLGDLILGAYIFDMV